ncbi:DUF6461 domain-containing protein [Actinoplanes sp. NBRC 101535]|uniref:DUF6461 domain-containing protein n=1 Tax=Actinoplanes sp. NBRC 101535 TaxID=3032196 RepID=UPI0024A1DD87|nr:DUF6461 domain-containing protein [Actinoplanes sp. NBRC 101535]GLY07309.1 hypothetical protein Acsp01_76880 [Actinoplanes sp. NBRC 101535]
MKRRAVLLLLAATGLASCADPEPAEPRTGVSSAAADYLWPVHSRELGQGFCFTLVQGLTPVEVVARLGGTELERVEWQRLVGPGDGERGDTGRFFLGVTRAGDDWSLIVEDNGALGVTESLVEPLSAGSTVLAYYSDAEEHGRLLALRDGDVVLDFDSGTPDRWGGSRPGDFVPAMRAAGLIGGTGVTGPTGPALAFLDGQTGVRLTHDFLAERTYLLVTVPKP